MHTNNLSRFASNASLGSEVRFRNGVGVRDGVRVREQRKVKRRSKALILDVTAQVGKNAQDVGMV